MSTLKLVSHSLAMAPYTLPGVSQYHLAPLSLSALQTEMELKQISLNLHFAKPIKLRTTSFSVQIILSIPHCWGCCLLDPLRFLHFCHGLCVYVCKKWTHWSIWGLTSAECIYKYNAFAPICCCTFK